MAKGLTGYRKHLPYYSPKATWKDIQQLLENSRDQFEDAYDSVVGTFKEFAQHEMSHSVCRLVRILSTEYMKAEALFRSVGGAINFTHMYALTPNEPGKLRVFTNFEITPGHTGEALTGACPYHQYSVVEALLKRINEDMSKPAQQKAWVPIARGRSRLKRYEDMPIERALMRYTDAKTRHNMNDAGIKQVAAAFEELRQPLELHFAETPEQVLYMYSSGPSSCMSAVGKERAWGSMTNHGRHPCDFFAYHPYVRGCYTKTKAKGAVTARVFLYTKENKQEYYGRIYGTDGRAATALKNALEEKGIRSLPDDGGTSRDGFSGMFARECTFKIPGVQMGSDWVVPFPYMDNLRGGVNFTFDEKTHEFTANCYDGSGYTIVDGKKIAYREFPSYTGITAGYISSSQLGTHTCHHCGAPINRTNKYLQYAERDTGHKYCGPGCLASLNKCIAIVGDSTRVIMNQSDAYYDGISGNFYTTEMACKERGGVPYEPDPCVRSEEVTLTTGGYAIADYRTSGSEYAEMANRVFGMNKILLEGRLKVEAKKYMEVDWSKHEGIRIIGEIPEDFHAEIDNRYGYPIAEETFRGRKISYAADKSNPTISNKIRGAIPLSAYSRLNEDQEVAA